MGNDIYNGHCKKYGMECFQNNNVLTEPKKSDMFNRKEMIDLSKEIATNGSPWNGFNAQIQTLFQDLQKWLEMKPNKN